MSESAASWGLPRCRSAVDWVKYAGLWSSCEAIAAAQSTSAASYSFRRSRALALCAKTAAVNGECVGACAASSDSVNAIAAASKSLVPAAVRPRSSAAPARFIRRNSDAHSAWSGSSLKPSRTCFMPWSKSSLRQSACPRAAYARTFPGSARITAAVVRMAPSHRPSAISARAHPS